MTSQTKAELLAENAKLKKRVASFERAKPKNSNGPGEAKRLRTDLLAAEQRLAATAEILKVIAASPSDVQPVFDAIAKSAARLLKTSRALVLRYDGEQLHFCASSGGSAASRKVTARHFPVAPKKNLKLLRRGTRVELRAMKTTEWTRDGERIK